MTNECAWSAVFASGAAAEMRMPVATPALLIGHVINRHVALLARLLGTPTNERRVLVVVLDDRARRIVGKYLPKTLRRLVWVITEERLADSVRELAVDSVLWLGGAGRFDEESGTFSDACSAHDRRILYALQALRVRLATDIPIYVTTRNPAHAALPDCLVPARMDGMDAELRAVIAAQFNMFFISQRTFDLHAHRRPAVVADDFADECTQDGADVLFALSARLPIKDPPYSGVWVASWLA